MTWEEAEAKVESSFKQYEHQGTRFGKKEEAAEDSTFEDAEGGLFDKVKSDEEAFLVKGLVMGGDQANVAMAAYAGTGKTTMCLGEHIELTIEDITEEKKDTEVKKKDTEVEEKDLKPGIHV